MSAAAYATYWAFVFLAVISLVGGWLLRRALVKSDERDKALAQPPSPGTHNLHT